MSLLGIIGHLRNKERRREKKSLIEGVKGLWSPVDYSEPLAIPGDPQKSVRFFLEKYHAQTRLNFLYCYDRNVIQALKQSDLLPSFAIATEKDRVAGLSVIARERIAMETAKYLDTQLGPAAARDVEITPLIEEFIHELMWVYACATPSQSEIAKADERYHAAPIGLRGKQSASEETLGERAEPVAPRSEPGITLEAFVSSSLKRMNEKLSHGIIRPMMDALRRPADEFKKEPLAEAEDIFRKFEIDADLLQSTMIQYFECHSRTETEIDDPANVLGEREEIIRGIVGSYVKFVKDTGRELYDREYKSLTTTDMFWRIAHGQKEVPSSLYKK